MVNSFKMAAAAMLPALLGAGVSGGSNMVSSLGTAGMQGYFGQKMQSSQQDYNTNIMNTAIKSYTDVGLPKYLAFQGGSGNDLPAMKYSMGGGNFWTGGPVNSNLPTMTTPYQQYSHLGTPKPSYNRVGPRELGESNEMDTFRGQAFVRAGGQTDRLGLGYTRYGGGGGMPRAQINGMLPTSTRPQGVDTAFKTALN